MKIAVIGDVHCCWRALNKTIRSICHNHKDISAIIQVGDFGQGWPKNSLREEYDVWNIPISFKRKKIPFYFLDGNNENFDYLEKNGSGSRWITYIPRGSILTLGDKNMLFFGGASSIDKKHRIPKVSWWPQENIKKQELDKVLEIDKKIDVVFSHERPENIPYKFKSMNPDFGYSDRLALEQVYQRFKPKFWFFGHWHLPDSGIIEDMQWICCPVIGENYPAWYVLFDEDNIKPSWTFVKQHQRIYSKLSGLWETI